MPSFTDKWGKSAAKSRYGASDQKISTADTGECYPQFREDKAAPGANNDTSGWVRGEKQNPNFKRGP
jgi:hypothetical protein